MNYDAVQLIVSPVTVEQTVIHIDLAQLGFPYHMTYAFLGLGPTYINPHSDPPNVNWSRCLRA
jgi:hypothetical protein